MQTVSPWKLDAHLTLQHLLCPIQGPRARSQCCVLRHPPRWEMRWIWPGGPLLIKAPSSSMKAMIICRVKVKSSSTVEPSKFNTLPSYRSQPLLRLLCVQHGDGRRRCPERSVPWLGWGQFQGYDNESTLSYSSETG